MDSQGTQSGSGGAPTVLLQALSSVKNFGFKFNWNEYGTSMPRRFNDVRLPRHTSSYPGFFPVGSTALYHDILGKKII